MKAYITKYALTRGIIEVDKPEFNPFKYTVFFEGKSISAEHWYDNIDSAKIKADNMRCAAIQKLEKQIEILKNKTF